MAGKTQERQTERDHNVDRFPTAKEAFSRLQSAERLPEGQVEYIHVTCMANGELSWQIRPARAEETEVGWVPPPE